MALANKLQQYAEQTWRWKIDGMNWPTDWSIRLLSANHAPRNLRQYTANEILLRVVQIEYGRAHV